MSGPLIDRIDIHIEVPAVSLAELRRHREGTSSATLRRQVLEARERQRQRYGRDSTMTNGRMNNKMIREHCRLDSMGESVLSQAMTELGLSARAHDKVLRVSRTIADLADAPEVKAEHMLEAIQYRRLDRRF